MLPNGHLRSRRWRLVVIASVTGSVLITLAAPLSPGPLEEMGIDNPFGLAGPAGDVAQVLTIVGVLLHWLSLPPAAVCVVLRFRSSRGVERQQMRWVAAGAAGAVVGWRWAVTVAAVDEDHRESGILRRSHPGDIEADAIEGERFVDLRLADAERHIFLLHPLLRDLVAAVDIARQRHHLVAARSHRRCAACRSGTFEVCRPRLR